jgi:dTDP-4-dehydrorhamnose 3,5-epimerase
MALAVIDTIFDAAKVFVPDVYEDDRGFFKEIYATQRYLEAGIADTFLQDSISYSTKNVIRGLHYDPAMSKFVQVLRGRVWDVIVDLREGSPTYRRWQGFYLSEYNHKQLYVPANFAHGFLALSDDVVVFYKQGALYDPARERGLRWNDPTLGIEWPLVGEPRVSLKDQAAPLL